MTRRASLVIVSLLGLVLGAGDALAAPGKGPQQQFYRYKNAQGNLVIETSIPPEYVSKGYQIVTVTGQIIQDVPPAENQAPAERREQSEDAARNLKFDNQLRKLYSSPADAVRHRDRQIDALKLKADFARGQVLQLGNKRKAELEQAARLERSGKKVPEPLRASLQSLDNKIVAQEQEMKESEAGIQRLREEFGTVIERLNAIYPDKAIRVAPATPAAEEAAPAAAPAKP